MAACHNANNRLTLKHDGCHYTNGSLVVFVIRMLCRVKVKKSQEEQFYISDVVYLLEDTSGGDRKMYISLTLSNRRRIKL